MRMKNKIIKNLNFVFIYLIAILLFSSLVSASYNDKNAELLGKLLDLNNVSYEEISINADEVKIIIEASLADEFDTQLVQWFGMIFVNAGFLQGESSDYKYIILQLNVNDEPTAYISANRLSVVDLTNDVIDEEVFWNEVTITKGEPSKKDIKEGGTLSDELLGSTSSGFNINILKNLLWIVLITVLVVVGFKYFKRSKKNNKTKDKVKNKNRTEAKKDKSSEFKEKLSIASEKIRMQSIIAGENIKKHSEFAAKSINKHSKVAAKEIKKHAIKAKDSAKEYYDTKGKHQIKKAVDTTKDIAKKTSKKFSKIGKDAHSYGKEFIAKNKNTKNKKDNSKTKAK